MSRTRPFVKNILLLDSNGRRIAVKYFTKDCPSNSSETNFEKLVFQKTNASTEGEVAMFENNIVMFENNIVVYKFVGDLGFFVTGGDNENELILATVLETFFDSVGLLLSGNVNKKEALEKLDLIMLCIDQIVDDGIILETDPNLITKQVVATTDEKLSMFDVTPAEKAKLRRMAIADDRYNRSCAKKYTHEI